MRVSKRVQIEDAGRTEADWSAAPRSSTGLPDFVEDDYPHLLGVPADAGPSVPIDPLTRELTAHIDALLKAGGEDRDEEGSLGVMTRIAARLPHR